MQLLPGIRTRSLQTILADASATLYAQLVVIDSRCHVREDKDVDFLYFHADSRSVHSCGPFGITTFERGMREK